jgi:hypothetical protein
MASPKASNALRLPLNPFCQLVMTDEIQKNFSCILFAAYLQSEIFLPNKKKRTKRRMLIG